MIALLASLLSSTAVAGFTVEGPPATSKADASSLAKTAKSVGHKGRVVRQIRDGEGWVYVVVIAFDDAESAHAAAQKVGEKAKVDLRVYDEDHVVVPAPAPALVVDNSDEPPQREWLADALDAHGPGTAILGEAKTVKVIYTRSYEDGVKARHVFAQRGTDQYLSIQGESGDVTNSETVTVQDNAWLKADGKVTPQDLQRTRERLETFSPIAIAPFVLQLDTALKLHPELSGLQPKGRAKIGDQVCEVAGTADDQTLVALGRKSLVRRLAVDGQKRSYEFSDYRDVDGLMVPHEITTMIDGKVRDTLVISEFTIDVDLPSGWFTPPG